MDMRAISTAKDARENSKVLESRDIDNCLIIRFGLSENYPIAEDTFQAHCVSCPPAKRVRYEAVHKIQKVSVFLLFSMK